MKPTARVRSFLAITGSSLIAITYSHAGTLYWDGLNPAGAPGGGTGTWNTTLTNWDTTQSADSSTAWVNANLDTAVFGGIASQTSVPVSLGSNITVGGLRFDTTDYVISTGANTLSFGTGTNTILFNNGIAAATITGTVGGTGNVILSNTNYSTPGTLTFNGASTGGWSGTTTINAGMTLTTVSTVALTNKVLGSTTGGITLNGGAIQFTRDGNTDLDAISDNAIGVYGGGTFSVTSSNGGASASETIGTVTVNSGQMNFVQTANNANQLVLGGLSRGASTTSAVTFSSAAFGTAKFVVTGAGGLTAANEIFAPWVTTGTSAAAQTDYAVFNASNEVGARGITATAQSAPWSTVYAATSNYTLANAAGSAVNGRLTLTRKVNTVRNTTASNAATANDVGDYFSLAGHTFANGDVVSASGTGGLLVGGDTYYVINSGVGAADRFQLSTTSGGGAVNLTNTTGGTITGGITLSTGNNLETYGILNGSTAALAIGGATGTGVLTTPNGGGSLYLTTGSGGIFINAPITNAVGGGVVTVVKNGSTGRLNLSGNNTFTGGLVVNGGGAGNAVQLFGTQTFTGGITLNGGSLGENSANSTPTTLASTLNGNAITVNGPAALVVDGTLPTSSTITINSNAILKLGGAALTVQGVVSGSGVLDVNANNWNATYSVSLTNALNDFSGNVIFTEQNGVRSLNVNSIGDSGKVTFGLGTSSQTFALNTGAAAMTLGTRQFEIAGLGNTNKISNNSANAFIISTDLLTTATGNRTLTFGGSGAGLGTFSGKLADGSLTSLAISKVDASNTWTLTNTSNSYTGGTSVAAGTLSLGASDVLGSGAVTVTGGTLQLSTFSDTVGVVTISGGTIDGSTGVLTGSSVVASGASTISAILGGSGSLNKFGSATSTSLTKANTYSGGTNVFGGTLAVGASGTLGQNTSLNSININEQGILTLAAVGNSGSNQAITLTSSSTTDGRVGTLAVLGLGFNGLPAGAISQANTVGGVIALNGVTGYTTDLSTLLTSKNLFLGATATSTFTGVAGTVVAGTGSLYRLGGGGGQITFSTTNLFTSTNGVQAGSFLTNGGGTVVIQAAQDYSGATTVSAGTLTLSGTAGSATGSTSFTLNGGKLFLDSGTNNNANRIGTVAVALSNGGELSLSGINTGSGTTEQIGDLSIGAGTSTVTVKATTFSSVLQAGAFSRSNNGTALIRGTTLGQNVTPMGRITLTDTTGLSFVGATTLAGESSGDLTKNVRIIPYLVGDTSDTGTGTTFVTYDTTLGFRALNTTNQFNTTATAGTNVRLAALQTGINNMSINSLIIANTGSSTITDGQTLTVASGAVLFSSAGTIAPTSSTGTLDFGAAQGVITTPANGVISAKITGTNGIVKAGTGSLTLNNTNNTFSGGIVMNGGTLIIAADSNLGNTSGGLTFNGTSALSSSAVVTLNAGRTITVNEGANANFTGLVSNSTFAGKVTGSGAISVLNFNDYKFTATNNDFTGTVNIATAANIGYGFSATSIGDAAGSGLINLGVAGGQGGGTFRWFGSSGSTTTFTNRQFALAGAITAQTFNGVSYNTGGVISAFGSTAADNLVITKDLLITGAAGNRALSLAGTNLGNNTFSGAIADGPGGATVISLVKQEAGTWRVTGANTYSGKTSISGGTLSINSIQNAGSSTANALGTPAAGANSIIDLGTGGTLQYTGTGHSSDRVINLVSSGTFTLDASGASGTFALTGGLANATTSSTSTVVLTGTGLGSQSGSIVNGTGTNTTIVTKNGIGTWTLGGANTHTGATTINAGTLTLTNNLALQNSALTFTAASQLVLSGIATPTIGGLNSNVDLASVSGFSNVTTLTLNPQAGVTATYGGILSNGSGAMNFVKSGAGTQVLNGVPTYTGATTISAGTLTLTGGVTGGSTVLGSGGITLSQGALLYFNPTNQALQTTVGFNTASAINLSGGAGTATIRFANNDNKFALSGKVTGQAGVAQTLAIIQGGISPVSGDRQNILFSGAIANGASGGTLAVTVDFANASTAAQNAFVNLSGQNTFTGDIAITNTKGLNAGGGSYLGAWVTIGGERFRNNVAGTDVANVGTGFLGGGDYSGNISISNGAGLTTLSYLSSANQILRGNISGTGSLRMDGTGSLTLTGTNTYTGSTTVSAGTLAGTQTSGTPFGTGAVFNNAGILSIAPTGSGSAVSLTGGTVAAGTLYTYGADAMLSLARGSQTSLTYTFGGTGATTARGTNGTLILSTSDIANFGATGSNLERFIMNGTAPTQVNTFVSGVVIQDRNSGSNAGDFAAYDVTHGFTKASYTHTNDFTGSTNASRVEITSATATGTIAAYALKVSGATVTNSGTITLGSSANPVAGLILNGATLSGGILTTPTSSATEFSIYTSGTSVISSNINTATSQAGMSVFGPGTLALTAATANTFIGGLRINNSTVIATNDNQLGNATAQINLTGGTLQTSGTFGLGGAAQRGIVLTAGQDQLGGTFNVTGGTTTFQNASGKILSGTGALTKTGAGTMVLSGNTTNTYTGGTFVNTGTLQLGAANMLADTGAVTVAGGTFSIQGNNDTVGAVTLTSGSITGSGGTLTGSSYAVQSGSVSAILGGTAALTKTTAGTVTLTGANTYSGTTTVNAGTLRINGSTSSTSLVTVNTGGTLGGTGTIGGSVTLNDGAFLSPGASIESLATGSNTWNGGSTFIFEFSTNGSTGAAGTEWDLLAITGTLDLAGASNMNPINFDLITMSDASSSGLLGTWNPNSSAVWSGFVTTTGGITGFAANLFNINATGFQNPVNGSFSIAQSGNNLNLIYTAVPEPRAALLGGLGMLMLLRRRRR